MSINECTRSCLLRKADSTGNWSCLGVAKLECLGSSEERIATSQVSATESKVDGQVVYTESLFSYTQRISSVRYVPGKEEAWGLVAERVALGIMHDRRFRY